MIERIMFTADWCSRCKEFKVAAESLGYTMMDVDKQPAGDIAKFYHVTGLPTFLIKTEARVLGMLSQPDTEDELRKFTEEHKMH